MSIKRSMKKGQHSRSLFLVRNPNGAGVAVGDYDLRSRRTQQFFNIEIRNMVDTNFYKIRGAPELPELCEGRLHRARGDGENDLHDGRPCSNERTCAAVSRTPAAALPIATGSV